MFLAAGNLILAQFQKWLRKQLEKNQIQLVGVMEWLLPISPEKATTCAREHWCAPCALPAV